MYKPSCIPYINVLMYFAWLGGKRIKKNLGFNLFNMSTNNLLNCNPKTDWRKFCLCQTDIKEELKSPPTHYVYSMIAKTLPQFQAIHLLLIRFDPSRFSDACGIKDILRQNSAKHHQNCRKMFVSNETWAGH